MEQQTNWQYGNFKITEGLKPGSQKFQYFFLVQDGDNKKCNYCVWIADEVLDRFAPGGGFEDIVKTRRDEWQKWVQGKIDQGDFRNLALRHESSGQTEVVLDELDEKLTSI